MSNVRPMFDEMSKGKDYISKDDVKGFLLSTGTSQENLEASVKEMFEADTSGDGKISFEEFEKIMKEVEEKPVDKEAAQKLFDELCKKQPDGNETLSLKEFMGIFANDYHHLAADKDTVEHVFNTATGGSDQMTFDLFYKSGVASVAAILLNNPPNA